MLNRLFLIGCIAVVAANTNEVFGQAPGVKLFLFPHTGEIRIANDDLTSFTFVAYTLSSPSGALNGTDGIWKSIADTYDASGNGFIDPTNEWAEFTPDAGTHAISLSEGTFATPGSVFPANRSLSLGKIWDPNRTPTPDVTLKVYFSDIVESNYNGIRAVDGDYLRDGQVNVFDYAYWKASFGATPAVPGFNAVDGNLDGIINAADYTIWRNNLGLSVPRSGSGEAGLAAMGLSATVVPEPAGIFLGLLAFVGCLSRRFWRRRSPS